jgi:hypothetical protein
MLVIAYQTLDGTESSSETLVIAYQTGDGTGSSSERYLLPTRLKMGQEVPPKR